MIIEKPRKTPLEREMAEAHSYLYKPAAAILMCNFRGIHGVGFGNALYIKLLSEKNQRRLSENALFLRKFVINFRKRGVAKKGLLCFITHVSSEKAV